MQTSTSGARLGKTSILMKKSSHSSKPKKADSPGRLVKKIGPLEEPPVLDGSTDETRLGVDQFAVAGREEEASSSGHRVEPIEDDDEHNAEKLIEEGMHGYLRASPNKSHKAK